MATTFLSASSGPFVSLNLLPSDFESGNPFHDRNSHEALRRRATRVASNILRTDPLSADEVADAVIGKTWESMNGSPSVPVSQIYGHCIKTTCRRALDIIRKRGVINFCSLSATRNADGDEIDIPSDAPSGLDHAVNNELRAAVAELPDKQKQVVTLTLEGLCQVDIAEELDCSPKAVERAYSRTLKNLRKRLATHLIVSAA